MDYLTNYIYRDTVDHMAADLLSRRRVSDFEKIYFITHGAGGLVAEQIALTWNERFEIAAILQMSPPQGGPSIAPAHLTLDNFNSLNRADPF